MLQKKKKKTARDLLHIYVCMITYYYNNKIYLYIISLYDTEYV